MHLSVALHGPPRERETYQVVAEKLHDQSRILVAFLAQGVQLCKRSQVSKGILVLVDVFQDFWY